LAWLDMSATNFIASLVSSLAWPAVVVAILVIFRRQFATMLERLSRVKLGGGQSAESDWHRTEDTVRQSLSSGRQAAISGLREPGSPAGGQPQPGSRGSPGRPLALIDDRWSALETELRNVIRPASAVAEMELAGANFDALLDIALRAGLLDAAAVRSLDGMRHLRNLARADDHLTVKGAEDFAVMADALCYGMRTQISQG
jgi:hypothetical protein